MGSHRSPRPWLAVLVASVAVTAGCTTADAPTAPTSAAESASATPTGDSSAAPAPASPPVVDPWHRVPDLRTEPSRAWEVSIDAHTGSWLFDGAIVVEDGTGLAGYDTATGTERWHLPSPGSQCNATIVLITCASAGGELTTIDPASGNASTVEIAGAFAGIGVGGDLVVWRDGGESTVVERHRGDDVLWSHPSAVVEDTAITVLNGTVLAAGGGDNGTGDVLDAATGAPVYPDLQQANRWNQSRWVVYTESEVWEVAAGSSSRKVDNPSGVPIADSDPGEPPPPEPSSEPLGAFARAGSVAFHAFPEHGPTAFTARDLSTGAELWVGPAVHTRGNLMWVEATVLAVAPAEPVGGGFVALDARTGEVVWELAPETEIHRVLSDGESLVVISEETVQSWLLGG